MSDTVARLRELLAAATPGPWSAGYIRSALRYVRKNDLAYYDDDGEEEYNTPQRDDEDTALIVAAVNHLGRLLDVAEKAEAWRVALARSVEECDELHGGAEDALRAALARLGEAAK